MPTVDLTQFAKRNMWPLQSGELAVRPGIKLIDGTWSRYVETFHVVADGNRDIVTYWFYTEAFSATLGQRAAVDVINWDPTLSVIPGVIQSIAVNQTSRLRVVTCAVVLDQVIFASPDMATLWGYAGGPLEECVYAESDNQETSAIQTIPRGLVASWMSRSVIADGRNVYISDVVSLSGGSPRTFVADNVNLQEGFVYGLFVGAGGALVMVTDKGVYAMPEDAAAVGQIVAGTTQKISNYTVTDYGKCAVAPNGRVYGLTEHGFRAVDTDNAPDIALDEPRAPTANGERIAFADWREAKMIPTPQGVAIVHPEGNAFYMYHSALGFGSWWTLPSAYSSHKVQSIQLGPWGDPVIYTDKAYFMVHGNYDGQDVDQAETDVFGAYIGKVQMASDSNRVLRRMDYSTDSLGDVTIIAADREVTATITSDVPLDGASTIWGTSAMKSKAIESRRFHFADRTDDLSMELSVEHPLSRMPPSVSAETKGPGRNRP